MIRVTVTLMNETDDNSYVAYTEEGDLLQVMTQVYEAVNDRLDNGYFPLDPLSGIEVDDGTLERGGGGPLQDDKEEDVEFIVTGRGPFDAFPGMRDGS